MCESSSASSRLRDDGVAEEGSVDGGRNVRHKFAQGARCPFAPVITADMRPQLFTSCSSCLPSGRRSRSKYFALRLFSRRPLGGDHKKNTALLAAEQTGPRCTAFPAAIAAVIGTCWIRSGESEPGIGPHRIEGSRTANRGFLQDFRFGRWHSSFRRSNRKKESIKFLLAVNRSFGVLEERWATAESAAKQERSLEFGWLPSGEPACRITRQAAHLPCDRIAASNRGSLR